MQVTEIGGRGLSRQFKVVLPAADLASRLQDELVDISAKVKLNGFRPGKVPMAHLKRLYGRSVMGEIVQNAVEEAKRNIVSDHGLRLALEPKIGLAGDPAEVERALEAKGDLAFTIDMETLPVFTTGRFSDLRLERPVAEVLESDIERVLYNAAERERIYEPRNNHNPWAETKDKIIVDFVGRIDGKAFEGGGGEDISVVLGSGTFIPGFEDALVGAHLGEERTFDITFPKAYLSPALAGRTATFEVKIKAIALPLPLPLDDEWAKGKGFETLEAMKSAIRAQKQAELDRASRDRVKRSLLDALAERYDFPVPEGMVAQEFDAIWRQILAEQKQSGRSFESDGATEEAVRAEYRHIAERRVRLGLVLADVGEKAGVKVEESEIRDALVQIARRYPGKEKEVVDHYKKNPEAMSEIMAPLVEDKVIDFIIAQATVTDRIVSRQELFAMDEDDEPSERPSATLALEGPRAEATAASPRDATAVEATVSQGEAPVSHVETSGEAQASLEPAASETSRDASPTALEA